MLNRFAQDAKHIYLALGATDFRKQISSLVSLVHLQLGLDPFSESSVFIFCNKRKDSIKALRYDKNGFVLANKKLLEKMKCQWPKDSSGSYMWVMRSAASEDIQAAYFFYSKLRSTEVAKSLLGDYTGYLITDAYSGYNQAGIYNRCLCWAHCRRYYIESIPWDNNGKEIKGSKGAEGRAYIDLLFKVEKEIENLSFKEKKQKRQEASQPILDAFWSWVEETSAKHTTNEKLTQALTYSTNQRKYLETFMEDGRIPISNNLCEANIKPFATARRA
jgi:transposase